jgi:hypothetical protein
LTLPDEETVAEQIATQFETEFQAMSLLGRRTGEAVAFMLILVVAAYLRLRHLGQPGLWLDEVFGVYGIGPEHGSVYYAVMRLGQHYSDAIVRLPFVAASLLTILGAGLLARRLFDPLTGILASMLLAVSPIHVYYSREARPYALLLLGWTIAAGLVFLVSSARRWRLAAIALAVTLCLLPLLSLLSALYFASLFGIALWLWASGDMGHSRMLAIVLAVTAGALALAWLYGASISKGLGSSDVSVGATVRLLQTLVSGTSEVESGRPLAIVLAVALLGAAFAAPNRASDARWAFLCSTLAGIGATFGVFWIGNKWLTARYLLCLLLPLTILLAFGMRNVGRVVAFRVAAFWRAGQRLRAAALVVLVLTLAADALHVQWLTIARGARLKADWRKVAEIIDQRSKDADVVIASNPWNALCLRYHLPRVGSRVHVLEAEESVDLASNLASKAGTAFLVSGAYDGSIDVPAWMARFEGVYESPLERIRVTLYPVTRAHSDR